MMRRIPACLAAALVLVVGGASTAQAAPDLTVTNVAQPGYASVPPIAPVIVGARGACPEPPTVDEANGAAGPCGAGAWPAMGGDWSTPALPAAGGDRLLLHLDLVPDEVRYSVITNWPVGFSMPGIVAPPGSGPGAPPTPLPNSAVAAPSAAVAPTADVADWSIALPTLTELGPGMDLAVTARTGAVWAAYAVALHSPRLLNPDERCPTAFYNPGMTRPQVCSGIPKGAPPGFGPSDPLSPIMLAPSERPAAVLATAPRLRGRTVTATIRASVPVTVTVALSRSAAHAPVLVRARRTLPARTTAIHVTVPAAADRRLLARHARRIAYRITFKPRAGGLSRSLAGTFAIPLAARRRAS